MTCYAIKHDGHEERWVTWAREGDKIQLADMIPTLTGACLIREDQARGFMEKLHIDPRYQLFQVGFVLTRKLAR